jgi:hypothetical protein
MCVGPLQAAPFHKPERSRGTKQMCLQFSASFPLVGVENSDLDNFLLMTNAGFFYVVTASAAQTRWADAKPEFESILSSFTLSEPVTQPLEG